MTSTMSVSVLTQRLWVNFPHSSRGGSRIFLRRGCTRLLLYFKTNKPHSFFFFCRIPVVLENRRSSRGGGGGVGTPCTLPLDQPLRSPECNRLFTVVDPGEGPGGGGGPSPLCFDQNIWRSGSATVSWAASVFSRVFIVTHAPFVALAFGRPRNIPPRAEKTTTSVTHGTLKPNFP